MPKVFKALVAIIGLLMAVVWVQGTISPDTIAQQFSVQPVGIIGLNTFRADMLGFFLTAACFCFAFVINGNPQWLLAAMIGMLAAALGRGIGLLADGFAQESLGGMILELVFAAIFFAAYRNAKANS